MTDFKLFLSISIPSLLVIAETVLNWRLVMAPHGRVTIEQRIEERLNLLEGAVRNLDIRK